MKNSKLEVTLTEFRQEHVWTAEVNSTFSCNIQGILEVFNNFMVSDQQGFNWDSAQKVLKLVGLQPDSAIRT